MTRPTTTPPDDPPVLTIAQAARMLGVTPRTVQRWIRRGELPAPGLIGSRRYWSRSELVDAVMAAPREPEAQP